MAFEIRVPRLGWSMEEGTFLGWLKQEGEQVRAGESLFTLESEKAAQEIEATDSGILRIAPDAAEPGGTVLVGTLLGYLAGENEGVSFASTAELVIDEETAEPIGEGEVSGPAFPPSSAAPLPSFRTLGAVTISPRAARTAAALGVDWTLLHGTGKTGRIRERDVLAKARGSTLEHREKSGLREPNPAGRVVPISATRRTIARRMAAGIHEAAPVTLTTRADATNLVAAREQLKLLASSAETVPTFNDLIVKLTAAALQQHPMLTAQWREDAIFIPDAINIAIGIDTDTGLLAAVIPNVPALSLDQIVAAARTCIEQARAGRLAPEHLRDGTFTVTNLGSFGIETFTPIINLPQCAILGVGAISGGSVPLSLTFDHRVIDGAPAARFLATLRECIANPHHHFKP